MKSHWTLHCVHCLQVLDLARRHDSKIITSGKYEVIMGDARFCLIPRGQSSWTLRTFEAFFAGCIPVLLSDHVELPFERFVDYSKMSVKWPADKIDDSLVCPYFKTPACTQ
jgi:hypothetical protein